MSPDSDLYRNGFLGIELRKPAGWRFLPSAWSPLERAKRHPESDEIFRLAGRPFCCAMKPHGVHGFAEPTLQAIMRPSPAPAPGAMPGLMDALIAQLSQVHATLELEWNSAQLEISGYPAFGWRGVFDFEMVGDDGPSTVSARSRSYVVFARGLAFTVALSGSDDPKYYDESEFDSILASIRIR